MFADVPLTTDNADNVTGLPAQTVFGVAEALLIEGNGLTVTTTVAVDEHIPATPPTDCVPFKVNVVVVVGLKVYPFTASPDTPADGVQVNTS